MHISDGVLPVEVVVGAGVVTAGIAAALLARTEGEKIPRVALCTSFFFVASLVHVPLGPTSVHLLLIGLVGVIMGRLAFLPVLFGLILQALLLQHGGVTTIGVNALMMGPPAYVGYGIFRLGGRGPSAARDAVFGFLAGSVPVAVAALLLAGVLMTAGSSFFGVARLALLAHLPVAIVEGLVTAFVVGLLRKAKPEMLEGSDA